MVCLCVLFTSIDSFVDIRVVILELLLVAYFYYHYCNSLMIFYFNLLLCDNLKKLVMMYIFRISNSPISILTSINGIFFPRLVHYPCILKYILIFGCKNDFFVFKFFLICFMNISSDCVTFFWVCIMEAFLISSVRSCFFSIGPQEIKSLKEQAHLISTATQTYTKDKPPTWEKDR